MNDAGWGSVKFDTFDQLTDTLGLSADSVSTTKVGIVPNNTQKKSLHTWWVGKAQ
jgi:hypothetical protein